MEWMYKGVSGLVDREEYLCGRKIDKTFEIITREESGIKGDFDSLDAQLPQSIFDTSNALPSNSGTVTVDLAAKLREDPLYEIRMKQREQRRQLLDNPIKMKRLKTLLESTMKDDKKSRDKRKTRDESSDDSSSSSSSSDGDRRRKHTKRDKYNEKYSKYSDKHLDKKYKIDSKTSYNKHRRNNDSDRHKHNKSRVSDDKLNDRHSKSKSTKLSKDEIEKRRKEMMENAVWREEKRKSNIKLFNEDNNRETEFNESVKAAQFIKPLLNSVNESDSIETRIKQKRFTSQRSYNSMDTNFAKKS